MNRPIEPNLQPVFDRIDFVAKAVDGVVQAITGESYGFVIQIVAKQEGCASLMVTNISDQDAVISATESWLAEMRKK